MTTTILSLTISILFADFLVTFIPGANFTIVTKNTLKNGRASGIMSVIGIILANIINIIWTFSLAIFALQLPVVISKTLQFSGAAYLSYLGFTSILSAFQHHRPKKLTQKKKPKSTLWEGFFTCLLNPVPPAFYFSVLILIIAKSPPAWLYGFIIFGFIFNLLIGYGLIVLVFSHPRLQQKCLKMEAKIDFLFGIILLFFAWSLFFFHSDV